MDKGKAIELVKEYKRLVSAQMPIVDVYLYGSYSKDTYTPESDIDVAVIVDAADEDFFKDTPVLWKMRRKVSFLIEPVLLIRDSKDPLYADVLATGIAV